MRVETARIVHSWLGRAPRPYLLVALAVGLIFANSLLNGWTFDDHTVIAANPYIRRLSNIGLLFSDAYFLRAQEASWRPVVTATYFLDAAVWGLRPAGFHLTNVLLHLTAALLLLSRLRAWGAEGPAAVGGTLFFAVHSAVCEAVNAVGFREDLLVAVWGLLAWIGFDHAHQIPTSKPSSVNSSALQRWIGASLAALCLFLAQLSKETALFWPIFLAFLGWAKRSSGSRLSEAKAAPAVLLMLLFSATAIALVLQFLVFANPTPPSDIPWAWGSPWAAWLGAPRLVIRYVALALFPLNLSPDHPPLPAPHILAPFAVMGGTLAGFLIWLTTWLCRRHPRLAVGWLLFVLPLGPVVGLVPLAQPFAERFIYVPLLGAGWLAAIGLEALQKWARAAPPHSLRPRAVFWAVALVLTALAARTVARNREWSDNMTLFLPVARTNAASTRALQAKAIQFLHQKKYEDAAALLQRVTEKKPGSPEAFFLWGYALGEMGDYAAAAEKSHQATVLWPELADAHKNAAIYYARMNPPDSTRAAEHRRAFERLGSPD